MSEPTVGRCHVTAHGNARPEAGVTRGAPRRPVGLSLRRRHRLRSEVMASVGSIVILGWGSLLWKPRDLPRAGDWHQAGLLLPLEFSRVSRGGQLTLVLDPAHGVECDTWYVLSPQADIAVTVGDLRRREGTRSTRPIGYVAVDDARENGRLSDLTNRIRSWGTTRGFRGVVWTDLPSNFQEHTGQPFSVSAAATYLSHLEGKPLQDAREYIANAPKTSMTPLRRHVQESGWLGETDPPKGGRGV